MLPHRWIEQLLSLALPSLTLLLLPLLLTLFVVQDRVFQMLVEMVENAEHVDVGELRVSRERVEHSAVVGIEA